MPSSSTSTAVESLLAQPLAFSSEGTGDSSLVSATSRLAVKTSDGALLNVEVFDCTKSNDNTIASVLLLAIPGVCESAETKGIQALVKGAHDPSNKFNGKVAVLELEGHGLSSGARCLCPSFDRLVEQVLEALRVAVNELFSADVAQKVSVYLTGSSLGGALAIYAAQKSNLPIRGVAPIAPAVGVAPQMVPPSIVVYGLKALAYMAPSLRPSLTPYEDPSSYKCPANTKRNFERNWPLATSKMLLDATVHTIPGDVRKGHLSLAKVPSIFVVAGETDHIVPMQAVQTFYEGVQSPHKDILQLKRAGHDMVYRSKTSQQIAKAIFEWIYTREHGR